jgi:hypothetical protein
MPVVVNEFEVVPGAPAQNAPPTAEGPQQEPPAHDPAKAEEELVRSMRRLQTRAMRLHAS